MNSRNRLYLTLALLGLQVADLGTTYWALQNGAEETNPVVNALGWPATAAIKFGLVGLLLIVARRASTPAYDRALPFVVCLYVAVCLLNVKAAL